MIDFSILEEVGFKVKKNGKVEDTDPSDEKIVDIEEDEIHEVKDDESEDK